MTEPKLVFSQTVEGLFVRGLGDSMPLELRTSLREAGLDLDRKLDPAYPAEQWARWLQLACHALYSELAPEAAQRELGARFMRAYVDSVLGKAIVSVCRVIGPMKTLGRMERNFRTGTNYISTKLTPLGPTEAELWFNDVDDLPGYFAGIIECAGELMDFKQVRVAVLRREGAGCLYRVSWQA